MASGPFVQATGITRSQLWRAGFPKYTAAVEAAGLIPNQPTAATDPSSMFEALAGLARRLGKFPTKGDIKVARGKDAAFPSYEAYFRLSGQQFAALPAKLFDYCRSRKEFADVADLLGDPTAPPTIPAAAQGKLQRVVGYVYLAKHGRDYKIGRSNDVARRRREISLLLPNELEHVHVIETDDPEGIEAYWHRRFEKRRSRGEWFRLNPDDVAAFRRRRYQ